MGIKKLVERIVVVVVLCVKVVGESSIHFLEHVLRAALLAPWERFNLVPIVVINIELVVGVFFKCLHDAEAVEEFFISFTGVASHFFVARASVTCDDLIALATLACDVSRPMAAPACRIVVALSST